MSELPALHDALVGAAARRVRRRRRRAATAVGWIAVAAALAAVALLAGSGPRERERPAAPRPGGLLEQAFPVFARPTSAPDAVPRGLLSAPKAPFSLRGRPSRLALDAGGERIWLVAAKLRGRDWLCVVRAGPEAAGPSQCGELTAVAGSGMTLLVPPRGGRPANVVAVLPAGARELRVRMPGGTALSPPLRNGVARVDVPGVPASSGWTDAAGTRHVARFVRAVPRVPSGCPALGPLPADAAAQARRAALLAVDVLYPNAAGASVSGVARVGPGLCTRAVTDRSLLVSLRLAPPWARPTASASLTQGRLLVGMVDGRMAVWSVQH